MEKPYTTRFALASNWALTTELSTSSPNPCAQLLFTYSFLSSCNVIVMFQHIFMINIPIIYPLIHPTIHPPAHASIHPSTHPLIQALAHCKCCFCCWAPPPPAMGVTPVVVPVTSCLTLFESPQSVRPLPAKAILQSHPAGQDNVWVPDSLLQEIVSLMLRTNIGWHTNIPFYIIYQS